METLVHDNDPIFLHVHPVFRGSYWGNVNYDTREEPVCINRNHFADYFSLWKLVKLSSIDCRSL